MKTKAEEVVGYFNAFLRSYNRFRKDNNLSSSNKDSFEICTAMLDKLGRIARQVKHTKRNDSKPDWPEGMTEAVSGLFIYSIMLLNLYGVSISKGMKNELNNAVKQHSENNVSNVRS